MINVRAQLQTVIKTADFEKAEIEAIATHLSCDGKTISVLPGHISIDYIPETTWDEVGEFRKKIFAENVSEKAVYDRIVYGFAPSYDAFDDRSVIVFSSDTTQIPKTGSRSVVIDPSTELKFNSDDDACREWVATDKIDETGNELDYFHRRLALKTGCVVILTIMKIDIEQRTATFRVQFNLLRSGSVDNPFLHMDEMVITHDYVLPKDPLNLDSHFFGILDPVMNKLQIGNFRHFNTIVDGVEFGAGELLFKVIREYPEGTKNIPLIPEVAISNGATQVPPLNMYNRNLITSVNTVGYQTHLGAALAAVYPNIKGAGKKVYTSNSATPEGLRKPKIFDKYGTKRTPIKRPVVYKIPSQNPKSNTPIRGCIEIPSGYNDLVRELIAIRAVLDINGIQLSINPEDVKLAFPNSLKSVEEIKTELEEKVIKTREHRKEHAKMKKAQHHKAENEPVNPEITDAQAAFAKEQQSTAPAATQISDDDMLDNIMTTSETPIEAIKSIPQPSAVPFKF